MKSVMKHSFSQVPRAEIPRSTFDRSHGHKTTFDAGVLVPIFVDEALPGDTFTLRMTGFARLSTPIYPIMDNMMMDTHFFSIPVRQVWDNWKKFNGEQENPGDSTDFTIPQMVSPAVTGYAALSVADYMGIPTGVPGLSHSSLWHRAAHLLWNEWFRDQNMQDAVIVDKDDGPDDPAQYNTLLKRGKRHDYFTSCLPWPQKGPGVTIPLGGRADVKGIGKLNQVFSAVNQNVYETGASGTTMYPASAVFDNTANFQFQARGTAATGGFPDIYADLTTATAATINSLRQAFQIQKIFERDARGGTRYYEMVKAHFGVTDPGHAVMQRPIYLGGGSTHINITPVPQTSETGGTTPQGNLSGFGTASLHNHGFTSSFTEHCLIIGFVSVRADLTYQQGLNRMFSRRTRFDFYLPALSHIGEQAVLNKEIFAQGTANPTADAAVFGYAERFAEYRYKPSLITGIFRSNHPQSLDPWHLSQDFATLPVLDAAFIEENPPVDRIVAVPSEPHFLFDSYFQLHCARPMPVYGVPGLIDHF